MVKPYNEGSSVGVYIVQEAANGPTLAPDMPDELMVEDYVDGRELTCTVMGDRALTVTDIITDSWYDYRQIRRRGLATKCPPMCLLRFLMPVW